MKISNTILSRVGRVYHDIPVEGHVRNLGTENCEVSFRMTKEQEQIVRRHFNVPDDQNIQFCSSEIVEIGNGWWYAFSLSDRVDEALKAIMNVRAAINAVYTAAKIAINKQIEKARLAQQELIAKIRPRRIVVVKPVSRGYGSMVSIAVDRVKQAIMNPEPIRQFHQLTVEKIKALSGPPDLGIAVAGLQAKFGK